MARIYCSRCGSWVRDDDLTGDEIVVRHRMNAHDEMLPPIDSEFRAARVLAERPDDDPHTEGAYQICRWYRGGVFLRAEAEAVLRGIRNDTIPHTAQGR